MRLPPTAEGPRCGERRAKSASVRVTLVGLARRYAGVLKVLGVVAALCGLFLVGAATRPPPALAFVPSSSSDAGTPEVMVTMQAAAAPSAGGIATALPAASTPSAPSAIQGDAGVSIVVLNTATAQDLRRLPGIGPKRADAILALRARLGRFRSVDELLRVKGLGRKTLQRLRPLLRVDPPPE